LSDRRAEVTLTDIFDGEIRMKELNPDGIAPPFARYAHGVEVPEGARLVFTSGQLGLAADGSIPGEEGAQADICFANIDAILASAGASRADVVRINAFLTERAFMAGYMAARDRWLAGVERLPASTLMIVAGFTRPEFKVEVEVVAAVFSGG
jgi:enamine deaminase RidA (YjgF/YER057c/UK114 family)